MIKRLLMSATGALLPVLAAQGGGLEVVVTNVESSQGYIMVALYNSDATYMKEDLAVADAKVQARAGEVAVSFPDLGDGSYAVTLYHDANGNGKLDKTWLGLPKEGYGFGNNARGRMSAPSFAQSIVKVEGGTAIKVYLTY